MKIKDNEDKILNHSVYIYSNNFNKFSGIIFDERLKWSKLATNHDLNPVKQYAMKIEKKQ